MKKTLIILTIMLLSAGFLFASPSWIGVQGTGSYQKNTTTASFFGITTEQEHTMNLGGLQIAGTIYPGSSALGVGFLLGASKTFKATSGSTDLDVDDYPLTWNIGAMAKYRANMTEMIALEFGAGVLYNRTTQTYDFSGTPAEATLNTFDLASSVDLIIHLSDTLALVGGVGASFPLTTKGEYTLGGTTFEKDFDVTGFMITGQLGVAFGF